MSDEAKGAIADLTWLREQMPHTPDPKAFADRERAWNRIERMLKGRADPCPTCGGRVAAEVLAEGWANKDISDDQEYLLKHSGVSVWNTEYKRPADIPVAIIRRTLLTQDKEAGDALR